MKPVVRKVIEDYAATHSSKPSELLRELEAYTVKHCANAQMLIGPVEGALLQMLIRAIGARRVLEIELFTGYSALAMAEALPADGELISLEVDPEIAKIAQSFFDRSPHGRKIAIRIGAALGTIETLPAEESFDMVFIDADKENYANYYEAVLPLTRAGGLIVADNVLWSGRVLDPRKETDEAITRFNIRAQEDPRVENVLLTVRDGVMLIRKK